MVQSLVQRFENEDLELLTILANIAAIRIEQERLALIEVAERMLARELKQAASIQRRLLPAKAPEVPGFDLAGHNVACRTVGGDYYDFFVYADRKLGFVVGDVAGKGIPAALLMTSLKGGVQVLAEVPDDLGRLVGRMNRVVSANFPPNRFVSLFFGVPDPRTSELTYCNAGHTPPLLCRANGRSEMLKGGGGILGIMPDAVYEARACGEQIFGDDGKRRDIIRSKPLAYLFRGLFFRLVDYILQVFGLFLLSLRASLLDFPSVNL